MKVGFIGLGKLGLPVAEVMGKLGHHEVTGYDVRTVKSSSIRVAPTLKEAVAGQEIVFVAVETPHSPEYGGATSVKGLPLKDFDYSILKKCLASINLHSRAGQLVMIISTVLPGTTRRELRGEIPSAKLIYNPYLIAMGSERKDFLNPEMIILGSEDGGGLEAIRAFYSPLIENNCRYISGTWEEAESLKIFYNTFISAKLSLVNMIQDVAMRIGHMDVDVVTQALALSTERIMSPAYMRAGMGDGGPCHPRDNIALRWLSKKLELGYDLFDAVIESREGQARNLAECLLAHSAQITILGKTYKPGVALTVGSYSQLVAEMAVGMGGEVEFYDPLLGEEKHEFKDPHVYLISHWQDWVNEFPFVPGSTVIDPWRRMPPRDSLKVVHYGNTRHQR